MPASSNLSRIEPHGCIVCGKIFNLLVVYTPAGELVNWTVTSAGGRPLPDPLRPLVACDFHSQAAVENALAKYYPGMEQPEDNLED
jgi:hypothetical protein